MIRRAKIALFCLTLALCGCSSGTSEYANLSKAVLDQFGGSDSEVSLNQASAIPYATLGVRLGGSQQSIMVLATSTQEDRLWLAGAEAAITTRHGRVIQTAGFTHNLNNVAILAEDPGAGTIDYKYDLANPSIYGLLVHCKRQDLGVAQVTILDAQISTLHSIEDCDAATINWSFTNEFWSDPKTNFVWMSIQHTHPKEDALEIKALRPDAS